MPFQSKGLSQELLAIGSDKGYGNDRPPCAFRKSAKGNAFIISRKAFTICPLLGFDEDQRVRPDEGFEERCFFDGPTIH